MRQEFPGTIGGSGVESAAPPLEKPPVAAPPFPDALATPAAALAADLERLDGAKAGAAADSPETSVGTVEVKPAPQPEDVAAKAPEAKEPAEPGTPGFWVRLKYRWQEFREGRRTQAVASQLEKVVKQQAAARAEAEAHKKLIGDKRAELLTLQGQMAELGIDDSGEAARVMQAEMDQYAGLAGDAARRADSLKSGAVDLRARLEGHQMKRRSMMEAFNAPLTKKQEANKRELDVLSEVKARLEAKRRELEEQLAKLETARKGWLEASKGKKGAAKEALASAVKGANEKIKKLTGTLVEVSGEFEKTSRKIGILESANQDLEKRKVRLDEPQSKPETMPSVSPSGAETLAADAPAVNPRAETVAAAPAASSSASVEVTPAPPAPAVGAVAETEPAKPKTKEERWAGIVDMAREVRDLQNRSGNRME